MSIREQAIELLNQAKVASRDEKQYLLAQIKELCLHRDTSILPEIVPELCEFQLDLSVATRRALLPLLRDIAKDHPEYFPNLVGVISFLLDDDVESVKKACVITANNVFRPALMQIARRPPGEDAERDWRELAKLKDRLLALAASPLGDVSSVVPRFMGTLVLAFTQGAPLGPVRRQDTASGADASVLPALPPTHPFLRAVLLETEGRAVLQKMLRWLKEGGPEGAAFGQRHYIVLENSLQSIVTARAHLFDQIVPTMAEVLRRAAGVAPGALPGLRDTVGSLRSACVKLLREAPAPSAAAAALADAVEASGADDQARAAIAANPRLKNRLTVSVRQRLAAAAAVAAAPYQAAMHGAAQPAGMENDAFLREAAANTALEGLRKLPPPPPGHRQQQNQMLLQPMLGHELFEYVLAQLRPDQELAAFFSSVAEAEEAAAAKARLPQVVHDAVQQPDFSSGLGKRPASEALTEVDPTTEKRPRSDGDEWAAILGGGDGLNVLAQQPQQQQQQPLQQGQDGLVPLEAKVVQPPPPEPAKEDPDAAAWAMALHAFRRVVKAESGAALEGQQEVYRKAVAKLARMLAEGGKENSSSGGESGSIGGSGVMEEVVVHLAADYGRRFPAAVAVLYELYVAELVGSPMGNTTTAGGSETATGSSSSSGAAVKEEISNGHAVPFALYDSTLLALLRCLVALQERGARGRQAGTGALFTKTAVSAPRVPQAALRLIFDFCESSGNDPDAVKVGLATLKGLLLERPTTRDACLEAVLGFTLRPEVELQRVAVQLTINILWPMRQFEDAIEAFADATLQSVIPAPPPEQSEAEISAKMETDMDAEGGETNGAASAEAATAAAAAAAKRAVATRLKLAHLWPEAPATSEEAVRRLALCFALCTRSQPKLRRVFDAYATAGEPVRKAIESKLGEFGSAAVARMGGPAVLALAAACPAAADPLVHRLLELLVPKDKNRPSAEIEKAVEELRVARVAVLAKEDAAAAAEGEAAAKSGDKPAAASAADPGLRYIVPVVAALSEQKLKRLLPQLLAPTGRDKDAKVAREAFLRLAPPPALVARGAYSPMTPSGVLLLLHSFDFAKAGLAAGKVVDGIRLALGIPHINTVPALRDALHAMLKTAETEAAEKGAVGTPLGRMSPLFMVTAILAADHVPLRNFIAATVLPKLVKWEVWKDKRLWDGFILCAKKLAVESGATSFIAIAQLPAARVEELLKKLPGIKSGLEKYARTLVAVPSALKEALPSLNT